MLLKVSPELREWIKKEEGLRLTPYLCSRNHWTVGWGWNLDANPVSGITHTTRISLAKAEELLEISLNNAADAASNAFPWAARLDPVRQAVLLAMCFQLGVAGVRGFRKFLAALRDGDYATAAVEMLDSKWARSDSPARAKRSAKLVETGVWHV